MAELPSESSLLAPACRKAYPTNQPAAVLAAVKGKSLRDGLRPPLTAAARSGQSKTDRDEEMFAKGSNKEMKAKLGLTSIAPYK